MMNIFRSQKSGSNTEKKASLLWRLSNPRVGNTVAPLPKIWFRLVHVIAACFVAYKLIPRNYPGVDDADAPLSLPAVIKEGWSRVRFTKETLPQAAAFFAVLAVLLIGAVAAFLALMSLAIGKAHAADEGMFEPADDDAASAWLEFLFNKGELPTFGSGDAATQSFYGIQDAIIEALAFYSNAMLIIAALILFYHLASMIVETAHTGVPMGKRANQIWAPIRLVVAIAILVPINNGLNAGQYIIIRIAELGSGLASQTWNIFLTSMQDTKSMARARVPMVTDLAYKIMLSYACQEAFNRRLLHYVASAPQSMSMRYILDNTVEENLAPKTRLNNWIGTKVTLASKGNNVCGWYFIPEESTETDAVMKASANRAAALTSSAVRRVIPDLRKAGSEVAKLIPESEGGITRRDNRINPRLMTEAVRSLQAEVQREARSYGREVTDAEFQDVIETMKDYGWAFAGAYLATIERIQSNVGDAMRGSVPIASGAKVGTSIGGDGTVQQIRTDVLTKDLVAYMALLKRIYSNVNLTALNPSTTDITSASCDAMWGMAEEESGDIIDDFVDDLGSAINNGEWDKFFGGVADGFLHPDRTIGDFGNAVVGRVVEFIEDAGNVVIDAVFGLLDWAASWNGVWITGDGVTCNNGQSTFKLGIDLGSGTAVIQNLISYGHANVDTGLQCLAWAVAILVGSGLASMFGALGAMLGVIGSTGAMILFFLGTIFLLMGFVFAFILPMIVFFRFFFAVIIWLGEVLEAVLAVPVIAIAHLSPEGDGLPGARAIDAYTSIFSIFLRPVLSVFGLIMGLLIFMVAANFMNYGFGLAVAATGGTTYAHGILTKFVYTAIYTYAIFVLANQSFALIDDFPKGAMEWMKAKSSRVPDLGRYEQMQQYEQIVGGLVTKEGVDFSKQLGNKMQENVKAISGAGGGGGGGGGSEGDSSSGSGGGGGGGGGGGDAAKTAAKAVIV